MVGGDFLCVNPRDGNRSVGAARHRESGALDDGGYVDPPFIGISIMTDDETPAWCDSGILTPEERDPVRFRHVLQVRANEVVLALVSPVEGIRNRKAVFPTGKSLAREFHEFRHQIESVRSQKEAFFRRPCDQRVQQQAVGAADIEEIAAPVNGSNEDAACLFPPLRPTATSRLLVRIGRIGQVKLDNGLTKKAEVLLAWRVAANLPPALPRRMVLHAHASVRLAIAFQPTQRASRVHKAIMKIRSAAA